MIFYPSCILAIENESDRNFMMEIYAEYRDLMYYKISLVARGRKDEWEDILHDTAAALCDHIDTMRRLNRPRLTSYVVVAAENQAKNFLRYQDRHKRVSFEEALDRSDPLDGGGAEEEIIRMERVDELYQVMGELDERSRSLLMAKYFLNRRDAEIAADLGVEEGSVRVYLSRARGKAKRLILARREEAEQ
ncbi:hypothetical protein CE91St43_26620 [Oscillospiraceae bacterium]|nr:hypothetical protein CE91St43_26620 [Oscillospiraceae bacterium]